MNQTYKFNFLVRLLASVSHIGGSAGIDAEFHRTKLIVGGEDLLIPTITGNSIRGQLRDASARHLLKTLDIDQLPLKAFYLLFSGGSLEKASGGLQLGALRRLQELLPSLSLFGGAVGNYIMPGKWSSGMLIPHAFETADLLGLEAEGLLSVYDLMQTEEYTRTDDAKNPRLEGMVEKADMAKYMLGQDARKSADYAAESGASQQMRYRVETMAAGSVLSWRVVLNNVNEMEFGAFFAALAEWGQVPTLGGKSAVGHGFVELHAPEVVYIAPDVVNVPGFSAYEAHLRTNREEIKGLLYGF